MKEQLNRMISVNDMMTSGYLDGKQLFMYYFNALPDVKYIGGVDGEKAFLFLSQKYASNCLYIHRSECYDMKRKKYEYDTSVIVFNECVIVEVGINYCEIFYLSSSCNEQFTGEIAKFKRRQRKKPLEINIVVRENGSLNLKSMEVKRTKLDLDLFYEDDFMKVDETIRKRLNSKNDKGIVLLHGLAGTGKTSYLRYLIGRIKKRILFISPCVAGNIVSPDFIELLVDNQDSVMIIEDAESVMQDRVSNSNSAVSGLLNISDGLLADFLNVQLICTFNSALHSIDKALLRKGRLIAKYEFGRLSVRKAQTLSDHFGFKTEIRKPMTIAEIANQHEPDVDTKHVEVIGFRKEYLIN